MQISITARHFDLSASLREHVENKLRKACNHLSKLPSNCKAVLHHDDKQHQCELSLRHLGHDITAHGDSQVDMYTAIDQAVNRLKRQLYDLTDKEHHSR